MGIYLSKAFALLVSSCWMHNIPFSMLLLFFFVFLKQCFFCFILLVSSCVVCLFSTTMSFYKVAMQGMRPGDVWNMKYKTKLFFCDWIHMDCTKVHYLYIISITNWKQKYERLLTWDKIMTLSCGILGILTGKDSNCFILQFRYDCIFVNKRAVNSRSVDSKSRCGNRYTTRSLLHISYYWSIILLRKQKCPDLTHYL